MNIITLTLNKLATKIINYNNKPHLVAPVVILVEGVHAGSEGPILYTKQELKKSVNAWNNANLQITHNIGEDGNYVSLSSDPEAVEKFAMGTLQDIEYYEDNNLGKLKGNMILLLLRKYVLV